MLEKKHYRFQCEILNLRYADAFMRVNILATPTYRTQPRQEIILRCKTNSSEDTALDNVNHYITSHRTAAVLFL